MPTWQLMMGEKVENLNYRAFIGLSWSNPRSGVTACLHGEGTMNLSKTRWLLWEIELNLRRFSISCNIRLLKRLNAVLRDFKKISITLVATIFMTWFSLYVTGFFFYLKWRIRNSITALICFCQYNMDFCIPLPFKW